MPEGQDPYGSFAYNQRIFKEMQSAINFRRTRSAGGMLIHTHNSNLGGSGGGFIPAQQFVLSNPITHVDRIVTPVLRSRIALAKTAAATASASTAAAATDGLRASGAPCMPPVATTREEPTSTRNDPVQAALLDKKLASADAAPTSASMPPMPASVLRKPPLPTAALARVASAAPVRAVPPRPSVNHFDRASSAGSRRSTNSDFSTKVAALEATLQFERDSRLKVQNDLVRLERILEAKLKQST